MTYNAAFATFHARDEDVRFPCALWYPTLEDEQTYNQGVYLFQTAKSAPIAQGSHPVVVMSHGSGGTRFGHCKTAEVLARNGYLVLCPEHPFNNFFDDSQTGTADSYARRSRDLKVALDKLLSLDPYGPAIDANKIAVFGFSLGGYTALCASGARPFVTGLRHHIRANREFDPLFSSYEVIVKSGFQDDFLPVTPDPRYKACIALAPVSGGLFTKDALKDVSVPTLLFRAERDMVLRHPFHAEEIRTHLPTPPHYHVTPKAGHFSYLSPVREEVKDGLGELANDAPGFDRQAVHEEMHDVILTFLHKALS